jgi:hypothetical protein
LTETRPDGAVAANREVAERSIASAADPASRQPVQEARRTLAPIRHYAVLIVSTAALLVSIGSIAQVTGNSPPLRAQLSHIASDKEAVLGANLVRALAITMLKVSAASSQARNPIPEGGRLVAPLVAALLRVVDDEAAWRDFLDNSLLLTRRPDPSGPWPIIFYDPFLDLAVVSKWAFSDSDSPAVELFFVSGDQIREASERTSPNSATRPVPVVAGFFDLVQRTETGLGRLQSEGPVPAGLPAGAVRRVLDDGLRAKRQLASGADKLLAPLVIKFDQAYTAGNLAEIMSLFDARLRNNASQISLVRQALEIPAEYRAMALAGVIRSGNTAIVAARLGDRGGLMMFREYLGDAPPSLVHMSVANIYRLPHITLGSGSKP